MNQDELSGGHRPPLQRLKRLDRLFVSHPLYFVTACIENRKPILANARVHGDFRKFCQAGLERGVFVGKCVLMPDHLHLFVAFGEEYETVLVERRKHRPSQTGATAGGAVAAICDRRPSDLRLSPLSEGMKSLKNSPSKTFRSVEVFFPLFRRSQTAATVAPRC